MCVHVTYNAEHFLHWENQSQQRGWLPSGIRFTQLCLILSTASLFICTHLYSCPVVSSACSASNYISKQFLFIYLIFTRETKECFAPPFLPVFLLHFSSTQCLSPALLVFYSYSMFVSFTVNRSSVKTNLTFIHSIAWEIIL